MTSGGAHLIEIVGMKGDGRGVWTVSGSESAEAVVDAEAEEVECPDCIRLSVCASIIIFGVA